MATEVRTRRVTADELFALPDDGFSHHELVRGELVRLTPPGGEHGEIAARVVELIAPFVREHRLGKVLVETGFRVESDPDTVRSPDAVFVASDRVPDGGTPKAYWPGAPDLPVEVVSPTDTYVEVQEKALEWLAFGARLVWVVAPHRRTVTVYRAPDDIVVLDAEATLDGGDVIPGWSAPVAELFA
jgi:Uma2 family endonuclease